MKAISIIETAYRATLEEQDDTIVWFTHAMRGAGAELAVVLCGNAVNYAVPGQDASGLAIGGWRQQHPPSLDQDIRGLVAKGVPVWVVAEDLAERGIDAARLVPSVNTVERAELPAILESCDAVWHW